MAGRFCALPIRAIISLTDGRSSSSESERRTEGKEFLCYWKHIEAIGIKSPLSSQQRLRRLRKEREGERDAVRERCRARGRESTNRKGKPIEEKRRWVLITGPAVSSRENRGTDGGRDGL